MTERRPPLLCRLWGHDPHPETAEYYYLYDCRRCGKLYESDMGARERLKVKQWVSRYAITSWLRGIRYWLRCSECGCRFGRHDYGRKTERESKGTTEQEPSGDSNRSEK